MKLSNLLILLCVSLCCVFLFFYIGTGKTTVARIYADFLKEVGILPGAAVEMTTGAKLRGGGEKALKEHLKKIESAGGGILFVDEAYQLVPHSGGGGQEDAPELDRLLTEMEDCKGKMVVVLAGYVSDMESLFNYNPGLPSRFPYNFHVTHKKKTPTAFYFHHLANGFV